MPRQYEQRKYKSITLGTREKYMEIIYYIRQYENDKIMLNQLLTSLSDITINNDGMPHGTDISNPTEIKAIMIVQLKEKIDVIESALEKVPIDLRRCVLKHVYNEAYYGDPDFDFANINTWKKWQQFFVCEVAKNKGDGVYVNMLRKYVDDGVIKYKRKTRERGI